MQFAVLWDWDGVVIDSSRQHELSWERLAEEEKRHLPTDHFVRGFGKKNAVIIPEILDWTKDSEEVERLGRRKEALYRLILQEEGKAPDLIPGVRRILKALSESGVPSVVATSTERENVDLIFEIMGLGAYFQDVVASEDVNRGKPDPEVFLKASEKAGIPPGRCIVCEDSLHGIEAGLNGGMRVVGVATTQPVSTLEAAGAHATIPDFKTVEPSFFAQLIL